jgi:hypothetical protein
MDLQEKLRQGFYELKDDPPDWRCRKPTRDPLLLKPAGELTAEQLAQIPSLQEKYERDLRAYERYWGSRKEKEAALHAQFWEDVHKEFGLPQGHPFAERLLGLAWERGHSSGYGEVVNCLQNLTGLWEVAIQCGMRADAR